VPLTRGGILEKTSHRGTRQTKRALDGMELATLFTHGYYVSYRWSPSAPANWRAILQGITGNLRPYNPIKVTMDYACRYIRATTTSNIASAIYDPASQRVTATLSGVTDIPTKFYLFMNDEASVMVDVPSFSGTATVDYTLPGPTAVAVTFGEMNRESADDGGLWQQEARLAVAFLRPWDRWTHSLRLWLGHLMGASSN